MNNPPRALAGLLLASAILPGCAAVSPWERGHLAKPQMAFQPSPSQAAFREHVYGSREAASGSGTTGGGGCGCY